MKYTIINKFTGKLYRDACGIYDNTDMPINEYVLQYVELTPELIALATNSIENTVLDATNTVYNTSTNTWTVVTKQLQNVDIVANRTKELLNLKAEAERFYAIQDLPVSLKAAVAEYISQLNAIVIPTDSSTRPENSESLISWPTKPWV